jgi:hypothetical protein
MLHCSLSFNYELSFPGISLSLTVVRTSEIRITVGPLQCSYFLVEPIPGYGKYLNMHVTSEILMNFQIHMDYFSH